MKKTILVTGATGFIGACLTRRLAVDSRDVHIFARKSSNKWRIRDILGSITEHCVDLRDRVSVERECGRLAPSVIFHLATYGGLHYETDTDRILKTNFIGTHNLVRACAHSGFDCFINLGSSSEYGPKRHPISEADALEPLDYYGVSKAAASLLCQFLGKATNLPIFTLRPFSPYGPYDDPTRLVPTVVMACLEGKNPRLLSPHSVRDFIFVDDVIDVIMLLSRAVLKGRDISNHVFNVGYGEQHSAQDVVSEIISLTRANVRPLWGRATGRKRFEPPMWLSDNSRIRKLLKWEPKFNLTSGLEKTVDWFRGNSHLYTRMQNKNQTLR